MLHFLRTHQRILFLILSIVIIISFAFFGTYSTFMSPAGEEEVVVHKTAQGRALTRTQVERMKRFLATDRDTIPSLSALPNFLNRGTLVNAVIESGALAEIAGHAAEDVQKELVAKLELEKQWRPYTHSESRDVSAAAVWQVFAPAIPENLQLLKQSRDLQHQLQAHFRLMQAEKNFPEAYLGQLLLWSQEKEAQINHEVEMQMGHLSLFGYKDMSDWLGAKLYDKLVFAIVDAAEEAAKEGILASDAELMAELRRCSEEGREFAKSQKFSFLELTHAGRFFQQQLQMQRMTDEELLTTFRPLYLAEKLMEKRARPANVEESFLVVIHEMNEGVQLSTESDLYAFETYLNKVSAKTGNLEIASLEELKKKAPELLQQRISLEVKEVSQELLPLQEVWKWQLSAAGWQKLRARFKELDSAQNEEERALRLDALPSPMRVQVDSFSRSEIWKANPQIIDQMLKESRYEKREIVVPLQGGSATFFKGLKEANVLLTKLASGSIDKISFDGASYYAVKLVHQDEPRLLSFAEAKDKLVVADKKNFVALVKGLVQEAKKCGLSQKPQEKEADFAARMRFIKYLQAEKERLSEPDILAAEKEAVNQLTRKESPFALRKRTIPSIIARKEGIVVGSMTTVQDRLCFTTKKEADSGEKMRSLMAASQKSREEAAYMLFKDR